MAGTQINLTIGWLWILLGFASGVYLGLRFHRETWMGGYSSWPRRLYRLGHISFFGLGTLNLLFYFTLRSLGQPTASLWVASWGLVLGAVTMPACCLVMAHRPKFHLLFTIPVTSLLIAGLILIWEVSL